MDTKETYLIRQPAGLGDIFFCMKIASTIKENGGKVIWPVYDTISYVKDYLKDGEIYVSINEFQTNEKYFKYHIAYNSNYALPTDDFEYIPLQSADSIYTNEKIMDSKYKLVDLDFSDWYDYFEFSRNIEKENHLFYDVLKLQDSDEYTFLNRNYGTPPYSKVFSIDISLFNNVIEMFISEEFSVFDWCKVIERASSIVMIDSSLNYIIEKLNLRTSCLYLYVRSGYFTYHQINHLFKKSWEYKI